MKRIVQLSDRKPETVLTTKAMAALSGVTPQRLFQLRAEGLAEMLSRNGWLLPETLRAMQAEIVAARAQAKADNRTINGLRGRLGLATRNLELEAALAHIQL